jgi:hypothetical protein
MKAGSTLLVSRICSAAEVVGYAMSERMTKALVMQALFRACATKRPLEGADSSFRQSRKVFFEWPCVRARQRLTGSGRNERSGRRS